MDQEIQKQIEALRCLKVNDLKARYRELFGEECRSSNRLHLFRRIAWRLQAQFEGELTQRARDRAAELAADVDLRLRAPKSFWGELADAGNQARRRNPKRDPRLPEPGAFLERIYGAQTVRVKVLEEGFELRRQTVCISELDRIEAEWNPLELVLFLPSKRREMTSSEPTAKRRLRCAIYTRKSTEEGLEQAFNTLQAQREAAEAYVQSQIQNGWVVVPEQFDDGGFSGASLERRPALQRLLAAMEGGEID